MRDRENDMSFRYFVCLILCLISFNSCGVMKEVIDIKVSTKWDMETLIRDLERREKYRAEDQRKIIDLLEKQVDLMKRQKEK